jgi:hypothetical protein
MMTELEESSKRAGKYEDCYRRCESCMIGISNAKEAHTCIYEDFHGNLHPELIGNIDAVLDQALNVRNRKNKRRKMGFSTSEDALTWSFFNYFVLKQKTDVLAKLFKMNSKIEDILLWGVSIKRKDQGLSENLKRICRELGESQNSYSEPDVIIKGKDEFIFVEVKLKSENDTQTKPTIFNRYLKDKYYRTPDSAIESGLYELVRNWTIGNLFAQDSNFRLINLGPQKCFTPIKMDKSLSVFESSLKVNEKRRFEKVSWESILAVLNNDVESWFLVDLNRRMI